MLSTVAQLPVPGWQTVTLVVSMLRVRPGAVLTVIGWTLGVVDCGTEADLPVTAVPDDDEAGVAAAGTLAALARVGVAEELLLPPPPQPASAAQIRSRVWK
ncbi:hypothetical protein WN982_06740 [Paraburkholderia sp. IMGN_8]|uniref:hypothetical protein n=1 Tax=Paraburkholderia sp. IMGN_8 TaxID=3136564 RepID=UPI003100D299